MNEAMADGGTIVQRVLRNEVTGKDMDYGEAALGKIFCDYVREQRDLTNSPWRTDANVNTLAETAEQVAALNITLPTEILDANRSVRPDRLQALYERLREHNDPTTLVPLRPGVEGTNERMKAIIQIVQEELGGVQDQSYVFYRWLAMQWIYNTPLKQIIDMRLGYLRSQGSDQSVSAVIRELLSTLEDAIRFRLVKYYMAYNAVLGLVLRERGHAAIAETLEPFHVYLECGASDRVALNLIALGLSRSTALALRGSMRVADDATPEQCLAQLATMDLRSLAIPTLCKREIHELLGKD
jgi:hypothetical protein